MGFACNPIKYMTNYRAAFQVLNAALIENTDDKGNIIDEVGGRMAIIQTIKKGEQYIGRTYDVNINFDENETRKSNDDEQTNE